MRRGLIVLRLVVLLLFATSVTAQQVSVGTPAPCQAKELEALQLKYDALAMKLAATNDAVDKLQKDITAHKRTTKKSAIKHILVVCKTIGMGGVAIWMGRKLP